MASKTYFQSAQHRVVWLTFALISLPLVGDRLLQASADAAHPSIEEMLSELHLLAPFWSSDVVHRESVLFVADAPDQPARGKLLFPAEKILKVTRADGAVAFDAGTDFQFQAGAAELTSPKGSRIPHLAAAELFPAKGDPRSIPQKTGDPNRSVLFDNGHWFHDQQVEVTYQRAPQAWPGGLPKLAEEHLPRTLARLRAKQKLTMAVSGDSISEGYNASGFSKAPPWMPPYPDLVAAQLRKSFGCQVELHNRAVGGWNSAQGVKDLDALLATKPDLIVIAYGMNDVGGRNPAAFKANIATMLTRTREKLPEAEVILVAPMLGNAYWVHTPREMFPKYRDALASLCGPGVALADLTAIWQEMLTRKREVDLTGNGVNHPSDFGHRVYAQAILSLLIAPADASTADAPVPVAQATSRFKLPPGFQATLFAGEPDVVQPIAFTFDDRGRMWVIENYSYPGWKGEAKDRVLIFDDRDGDGRFDDRKAFLSNGSNLSGIEWGFGGIWLCSTPNLVFVPDANGDDVPDGPAVVKLDGWDPTARHNVTSSLAWGVDGWLYGCNGILSNSKVGKPGTPEAERTPINCGVWRYHPTRAIFEAVAHGTTNPWGLDFDEYGQTFITNCVIEHLWHAVPGARFQRMFGEDFNRHSYQLMGTCADHIHWAGGHWTEARGGERHDVHGGGHAHVGAMIYLGDHFPQEYRQHLFTCNIHGNRLNQDVLDRKGSSYVAHHVADFLHAGDPWFRGLMVKYGPDGGVYVSDWTDTGECHNYEVADRANGRIYKITHGQPKPWRDNLAAADDARLVELTAVDNQWIARHARRQLQERRAAGRKIDTTALLKTLRDAPTDVAQLRALWTLWAIDAVNEDLLVQLLDSPHETVRGWAIRLEFEDRAASPSVLGKLAQVARGDSSPWVRMALASALQRIEPAERWAIAQGLVAHGEDASDINLTLMIWYAIEPLAGGDVTRAMQLAEASKVPLLRQFIARRVTAAADPAALAAVVAVLDRGDDALRAPMLAGLDQALAGRRRVPAPEGWSALYPQLARSESAAVRQPGMLLALKFGDEQALADLRRTAVDAKAATETRIAAIAALTEGKVPALSELLRPQLADAAVRIAVLRALAAYDDSATPAAVLKQYASFDLPARQEAINTLGARAAWAHALLDAVGQGTVPRADVSAFHVQQLQSLNDKALNERLAKLWSARPAAADRKALVTQYKQKLSGGALASGDRARGRAVFAKSCAACHKLFDTGGNIGPELTGAQRDNLDYVLTNVLDPSAVVAREYQMTLVQTSDGRVLAGIVKSEDEHSLAVQTTTELVRVPKDEIEARRATPNSMMPDGLLPSLTDDEVRDLVSYLASPAQVEPGR